MGNCWTRLADWLFPNPWDGMVIQTVGYNYKIYNVDAGMGTSVWQGIEPAMEPLVKAAPVPKSEETDPLLARKPVVESILSVQIPIRQQPQPQPQPQTKPQTPKQSPRLQTPRLQQPSLPPPPISLLTLTKQKYTPTSSPNCPPQPAPPQLQ
jgi:hypothetical protein